MTKYQSSFQRNIITLIYITFLRSCNSRNSFDNLDLSTQTLKPSITGFMATGNAANDNLGRSVKTAGDINNDGYDDIIVGAFGLNGNHGAAYVIYGEESSFLNIDLSITSLDPLTTGFMVTGGAANDQFGVSVSTAGDINKDGYDDIIVGASGKDSSRGAAYVIYGGPKSTLPNIDLSSTTLNPTLTGFLITGNAAGDYFGHSVSTAGDINKDGYDDIIVGAYGKNMAYVIYGGEKSTRSDIVLSSSGLHAVTTGFRITGNTAGDQLGRSVSRAGDINNDGYDDIIVGASAKNGNQGAAYVIYGGEKSAMPHWDFSSGATLTPSTTGFMITGNAAGDNLGLSVGTAGDINKDGYDDIIVGAYGKETVYVVYGGPKSTMSNWDFSSGAPLTPSTTGFMITGNAAGDYFGASVSTAGDVNNDGYDDIIVGAYQTNTAYVFYGGAKSTKSNIYLSTQTLDPLTTGFIIKGNAVGDRLGWSVSTARDINNDGYDDIIVGTSKTSGPGAAYVIFASCSPNCKQCSSESFCTECKNSYLMHQFECVAFCPVSTVATSSATCQDCPTGCFTCSSQGSCTSCSQGYTLSNSLCLESASPLQSQQKATQAVSSAAQGIGSVISVGSALFPLSTLVSKIVQSTRYLNISVTNDLTEVYQTWDTDIISWDVPNVMSDLDHFKKSPLLFAQYDISSPFLVNFWPTLINIGIGFGTFIACILFRKFCEHKRYKGWAYSLLLKLVAGSFNFALIQAYACLDDILFYLVLDIKTNPFNSFFSWSSTICAFIFLVLGCLLVFFNFWTVYKYQSIKKQGRKDLIEAFNDRNKYWELFYSDFSDDDLYTQSFFAILIVRSALSSFIITVFYDYALLQTSFLVILDIAIISFLYFKTPFNTLRAKLAQYYFETITVLVHFCTFILSLQDTFENPSDNVKVIISTGILYLNTTLVCGALGFMFIEIYKTISQKTRAARPKQYETIAIQYSTDDILTTTSEDQYLKTGTLRRLESSVDHQQQTSIPSENFNLLQEMNKKSTTDLSVLDLESSHVLESNLNAENSKELEIDQSTRIDQQRDQRATSIFHRRKLRVLQSRQKEN